MKIYICTFFLLCYSFLLFSQRNWLAHPFPGEAGRWVGSPYLLPNIPVPGGRNKLLHPGYRTGFHFFYYTPQGNLTGGLKVDFSENGFLHFGAAGTSYYTHDIAFIPYINLKKGNFARSSHFSVNLGTGIDFAYGRYVRYLDQPVQDLPFKKDISPVKMYCYIGCRLDRDIFQTFKRSSDKSSRVGMSYVDLSMLIPFNYAGNFFRGSSGFSRYVASFASIAFGQAIDIQSNKKDYNFSGQSARRFTNFVKFPSYFDPPRKNLYGGFHVEVAYQPMVANVRFVNTGNTASTNVRASYTNSFGYSLFWGNHRENNVADQNRKRLKPFQFGLLLGSSLTFRQVLRQRPDPAVYDYQMLEGYIGCRVGLGGFLYVFAGCGTFLPLVYHRTEMNGERISSEVLEFGQDDGISLKKNWFIGASIRHLFYFKIKPSPLNKALSGLHKPLFEYSIGVGF